MHTQGFANPKMFVNSVAQSVLIPAGKKVNVDYTVKTKILRCFIKSREFRLMIERSCKYIRLKNILNKN